MRGSLGQDARWAHRGVTTLFQSETNSFDSPRAARSMSNAAKHFSVSCRSPHRRAARQSKSGASFKIVRASSIRPHEQRQRAARTRCEKLWAGSFLVLAEIPTRHRLGSRGRRRPTSTHTPSSGISWGRSQNAFMSSKMSVTPSLKTLPMSRSTRRSRCSGCCRTKFAKLKPGV